MRWIWIEEVPPNYNLDNAPAEIFLTKIQSTTTWCKCKPKCSKHMALSYRVQVHGLTSLNACKEFLSVYNAIKIRELLQDCKSKALLKAISTRFNILEFSICLTNTCQWIWNWGTEDYEVNIFFARVSFVNHRDLCPDVNPVLFNAAPTVFLCN